MKTIISIFILSIIFLTGIVFPKKEQIYTQSFSICSEKLISHELRKPDNKLLNQHKKLQSNIKKLDKLIKELKKEEKRDIIKPDTISNIVVKDTIIKKERWFKRVIKKIIN
jgi:hypothetical protein